MKSSVYKTILIATVFTTTALHAVRVYVIFTPSHERFFNEWFKPSMPKDCELVIERIPQWCRSGSYGRSGWQKTMLAKVDLVIRGIKENWGSYFVHSDVDIQFFREITPGFERLIAIHDLVIQRDSPPVKGRPFGVPCAGFFVCRGNERTLQLWQEVRNYMIKHRVHDQRALLDLLMSHNQRIKVNWCYLPDSYMSAGTYLGHGWRQNQPFPVAEDIVLHHANWTEGMGNKIRQLRKVRDAVNARRLGRPTRGIIWKKSTETVPLEAELCT